jgi:16S rRNA (cytosine967-C5)-methyltransferase
VGFDRALVDAPCSGLGVLAQRPDLRWRAKPLPELQLALLRAAAERVRPGGTILYAVCTLNVDENEAVVDASGLEVDTSLADEWTAHRHPRRPEFLLTLPHRHRTSGFFVARLRRRNPKASRREVEHSHAAAIAKGEEAAAHAGQPKRAGVSPDTELS